MYAAEKPKPTQKPLSKLDRIVQRENAQKEAKKVQQAPVAPVAAEVAPAKKKLSYKLQRELEALPGKIDEAEQAIEALQTQISDPAFYQQPADVTAAVLSRLEALQLELDGLLERWAELEE